MFYVVMADVLKKETYVEYLSDKEYDIVLKTENPTRRMQSVFSTYKEAEREAKRISKPSYASGWSYNAERSKSE